MSAADTRTSLVDRASRSSSSTYQIPSLSSGSPRPNRIPLDRLSPIHRPVSRWQRALESRKSAMDAGTPSFGSCIVRSTSCPDSGTVFHSIGRTDDGTWFGPLSAGLSEMRPDDVSTELRRIAESLSGDEPSISGFESACRGVLAALSPRTAQEAQEGAFAAPEGQLLAHLGKWLTAKYRIDASYRSYADRVKGPWRDALVEHWYTHAKQERKQAYDIAMKIVALGGDPMQTVIDVPAAPANLGAFCAQLAQLELAAIENGRIAIQLAGENAPLRVLAEQVIYTDAQHLDDLRRMCAGFDVSVTA